MAAAVGLGRGGELDVALELFDEATDDLEAQRSGLSPVEVWVKPLAVIGNPQQNRLIRLGGEGDRDLGVGLIRKGVFQGIADQFIDDQAAGNGAVEI